MYSDWRLLPRADGLPVIMLTTRAEHRGPRGGARGEWGTGQRNGSWLIGFRLFAPDDDLEQLLLTDDVSESLLEAILDVPHLVVIVPRLGDPVVARVTERSSHVARLLSPRGTN